MLRTSLFLLLFFLSCLVSLDGFAQPNPPLTEKPTQDHLLRAVDVLLAGAPSPTARLSLMTGKIRDLQPGYEGRGHPEGEGQDLRRC